MKRQGLAFKKGRDRALNTSNAWSAHPLRGHNYGATRERSLYTETEKALENQNGPKQEKKPKDKKPDKFANRDFFLSILGSSATKREARSYLQRFNPQKDISPAAKSTTSDQGREAKQPQAHGVNLGAFYVTARAVENSPKFVRKPLDKLVVPELQGPVHVALVKIRAPQLIDDDTLDGIALTLSQLAKLGLTSTVVVDCETHTGAVFPGGDMRELAEEQASRIVTAIDAYGEPGSRKINNVIGISETKSDQISSASLVGGEIHVNYRKLLMTPLRRGVIPVIPAIGYTDKMQQASTVAADDIILALTREFAGFKTVGFSEEDPMAIADRLRALQSETSLDRLIVLDPLGGIPAADLPGGYHVFLNMEQEFPKVKKELLSLSSALPETPEMSTGEILLNHDSSHPMSTSAETQFEAQIAASDKPVNLNQARSELEVNQRHAQNLELIRNVLSLLPPSSSALLTTHSEAANSGKKSDAPFQGTGVGTRRQRNPLIHNLLTDKPAYSSSLPAGRLGKSASRSDIEVSLSKGISPTTFAKRGMPVTIFPDPSVHPWKPPIRGKTQLMLTDPRIDLPRLVHLIDDSFDRKLDVQNYLNRVNGRIAGVIIAGAYEGGALLTWETPPGVVDDGSEESKSRLVPYLDKFAVLKRSQGAGGVADVLFKAMVRDCFPEGVCWRSRRDNPVNKWYFERSRGTWKMPGTNWTMFWTTPELNKMAQTFTDYENVCRSIEPSWADEKTVID